VRVLLISTYDLGRQPFGLASPAAWLRAAGIEVTCADTSRARVEDHAFASAEAVGIYLPMHTATRLAMPLLARARRVNPGVRLCAFGLYAPLNEALLRQSGVDAVFDGEFEEDLTDWILDGIERVRPEAQETTGKSGIARLAFKVPDRSGLPPLDHYASLQHSDGARHLVGYTEASRGCKHLCRHCPIVPVYEGRFRVIRPEVVIEDIRAQVNAGARHITFGDPDFFNGIGHARRIVEAFAEAFPGVTYDVTIKIEHLLNHRDALPLLAQTGCLFVTSAVESVDDAVLARLKKGHTRAGFEAAVHACREAGVSLSPTFLPFTPWTTREGYVDLLSTVAALDLVGHIAPIQFAIRLLVPNGSRLLELEEVRRVLRPFDPRSLVFPWTHPDPQIDALQLEIEQIVGTTLGAPRADVFAQVWEAAHRGGEATAPVPVLAARATIPFLTEPWYC
jgi:radical SAM superfamily enzyme YgiQ (UPF0313 family)